MRYLCRGSDLGRKADIWFVFTVTPTGTGEWVPYDFTEHGALRPTDLVWRRGGARTCFDLAGPWVNEMYTGEEALPGNLPEPAGDFNKAIVNSRSPISKEDTTVKQPFTISAIFTPRTVTDATGADQTPPAEFAVEPQVVIASSFGDARVLLAQKLDPKYITKLDQVSFFALAHPIVVL